MIWNQIFSFPCSAWERAPGRSASLLLLAALLAAGCSSGPNEQLTKIQADKEQLLVTIRKQRDTNQAMHDQVASLESRLDQAEKQLARQSPAGTRVSTRPVETTPLPWRSPQP